MSGDSFRVLSLDGGGIKGTYTASVIATMEEALGQPITRYFDLITGTSTGGIIALALGLGLTGVQIRDLYSEHGPEIFGATGYYNALKSVFHPKHSNEGLRRTLSAVFGSKTLGHSKNRLVIPAFNCETGYTKQFKTAHHLRFENDYKEKAIAVALATSAAPTYFRAATSPDGQSFIDGGIYANSPIIVGILEAIYVLDARPSDVHVLSIGTTKVPYTVDSTQQAGGSFSWATGIAPLFMHAQMDAANGQANLICGARVTRINTVVEKGKFSFDDVRKIPSLILTGKDEAIRALDDPDQKMNRFFDKPAEPFQPLRGEGSPFRSQPANGVTTH